MKQSFRNGNIISNTSAISSDSSATLVEKSNKPFTRTNTQKQHQQNNPPKRRRVSAMAEGVQRKVSSVDQFSHLNSYYNVKSFGSQDDSDVFMEEVQRRKSIINTLLLPMVVSSGFVSSTANGVSDHIVRSISVFINIYKTLFFKILL